MADVGSTMRLTALGAALTVLAGLSTPVPASAAPLDEPPTLTVAVRYVDVDGRPASGPAMTSFELRGADPDGVGSDGPWSGSSTSVFGDTMTWTGLRPGAFTVRASAPSWGAAWFGDTPLASQAQVIVLSPGEDDRVEIELRPGAVVSGLVTRGGSVDAWLQDPDSGTWESMGRVSNVIRDDDTYTLESLPAGDYVLRAEDSTDWNRVFSDRYWKDSPTLAGATTVRLGAGSTTSGIDLRLRPWQTVSDRIAGSDRYATAVEVSRSAFTDPVPVVYLVSGANWPDALSAGPAAAVGDGALLLTDPRTLPGVVEDEIRRLSPERIVVVGSPLSVSSAVEARAQTLAPDVERLGGRDRYETSRLVVEDAFAGRPVENVFLATGTNFPDALAVGPVAGIDGDPVVLVDGARDRLDEPTRELATGLSPLGIQVIGSAAAVSDGILRELETEETSTDVRRVAGGDRIATSVAVNEANRGDPLNDRAFLARSDGFADALGAIAAASALRVRTYLTDDDCVRPAVFDSARREGIDRFTLLGGSGTLSPSVAALTRCS
ncbi:cell wall-binding repeat-containing protein [Rathayibacter caricis]|uniref:cell wall-binding repeat-containing protein n=1 Tax=Rathayibacter caricis TaxID=110936 RepID=UPI001472B8A7|nr:cell wall-binding repeat-containing protein [Rathayibacter caricis]